MNQYQNHPAQLPPSAQPVPYNDANVAVGASIGVAAAAMAFRATGNPVLTALAATLGVAGAYYGAQQTIQQNPNG